MRKKVERAITYAILSVATLITIYPIISIVLIALQKPGSGGTSLGIPQAISFDNFVRAWTVGRFDSYMLSSVIVTFSVVAIASFLSILTGYAFGTMSFPGSRTLFYLFLVGLIMPFEVALVALYYDFRSASLTDTYWALILPQAGLSMSFGTFWMRAHFLSAPKALIESARVDGATSWSILWRVLVPIGRPAIVTMMALMFMWTWNAFLIPLVMVSSEDLRTAPLGLAFFQGQFTSDISLLAAGAVIVALPVVFVYVLLQRHFIRGMASGSVKG